jgi:hypothetical protein
MKSEQLRSTPRGTGAAEPCLPPAGKCPSDSSFSSNSALVSHLIIKVCKGYQSLWPRALDTPLLEGRVGKEERPLSYLCVDFLEGVLVVPGALVKLLHDVLGICM